VEQFQTKVEAPDWAEPDEEVWFREPGEAPAEPPPFVDSEGNPIAAPVPAERTVPRRYEREEPPPPQEDELDREWLDRAVNPDREPRREPPPRRREPPMDRPRERQEI
jgi:hypothetical protein